MLTNVIQPTRANDFAGDVRHGLTLSGQKELPSKYLYNAVGSKLFEVICELPEYGLTRADERLLRRHAHEVADRIPGAAIVCELGSGSGRKTRWILEALSRRRRTSYYPIDISHDALAACERELSDIRSIGIVGLEREYLDGLLEVVARRPENQRILVLFLGSTIGNCSHPADVNFLREVRALLKPHDALLLGTDLEKPMTQLIEAYDDPLGVTAAFNRNLLSRVNHELGGNFDLSRFRHLARFNQETRSIEMHLQSVCAQTVTIAAAELAVPFTEGETIWTENSHKYTSDEVSRMAISAGFRCNAQWIDQEWPFAESLLIAE